MEDMTKISRLKYLFGWSLIFASINLLISCVPVAILAPTPETSIADVLPKNFLNIENEKYFVVSLWSENPILYYNPHEQRAEIIIGDGFIVRNDEVANLHEQLSSKFVIGIGSIFGNIGRDVYLVGVLLVSESSDMIFVSVRKNPAEILDVLWGEALAIFTCDSHKTLLKNMLITAELDIEHFDELFENFIKPQITMYDPHERNLYINLLKPLCP